MSISLFSIPQTAVPFKLNLRSFAVVVVVNMIVLKLLFVTICAAYRAPVWWSKINGRTRQWHLRVIAKARKLGRGRIDDRNRTTDDAV